MKFNCGLSKEEKECRKYSWHRWFAWYPVFYSRHNVCIWMEWIERKKVMVHYTGGMNTYYEYRSVRK